MASMAASPEDGSATVEAKSSSANGSRTGSFAGGGRGGFRGGTLKTSISSSLLVSSSEETSPFIMEPVTSISPDDLVPAAERAAGATKAGGFAVANPRELGALGLVPRGGSGASAPRGRFVSGGSDADATDDAGRADAGAGAGGLAGASSPLTGVGTSSSSRTSTSKSSKSSIAPDPRARH